ncbi:hypothetical protein NDA13_004636 [Ustilago tritici]|nr:hypothetical protein NDA13_004636 [Ustilago tritici]
MITTTDDSLDISAQLFWQSATPTSSTTQTGNISAPSQSGSTSTPDIYTSCASVKPNHIKAKLRWVQETYYKEKKKLLLTGAGILLEDMDASNPSYTSCLALHGLPPILDLMDPTNPPAAIASTSGASIAGAGDDDIFTTPFPSQA